MDYPIQHHATPSADDAHRPGRPCQAQRQPAHDITGIVHAQHHAGHADREHEHPRHHRDPHQHPARQQRDTQQHQRAVQRRRAGGVSGRERTAAGNRERVSEHRPCTADHDLAERFDAQFAQPRHDDDHGVRHPPRHRERDRRDHGDDVHRDRTAQIGHDTRHRGQPTVRHREPMHGRDDGSVHSVQWRPPRGHEHGQRHEHGERRRGRHEQGTPRHHNHARAGR